MTVQLKTLDALRDAIFDACRELDDAPALDGRSDIQRRESALKGIDETLEWRPLASFSASQLEFLELLMTYWRECEIEVGAAHPDPVQ